MDSHHRVKIHTKQFVRTKKLTCKFFIWKGPQENLLWNDDLKKAGGPDARGTVRPVEGLQAGEGHSLAQHRVTQHHLTKQAKYKY